MIHSNGGLGLRTPENMVVGMIPGWRSRTWVAGKSRKSVDVVSIEYVKHEH